MERAKVSNKELTLMFHGAPQVILVFSSEMACRAGCRVQRFLDIQPSRRVFVEFNVAEKDKFTSKGQLHGFTGKVYFYGHRLKSKY